MEESASHHVIICFFVCPRQQKYNSGTCQASRIRIFMISCMLQKMKNDENVIANPTRFEIIPGGFVAATQKENQIPEVEHETKLSLIQRIILCANGRCRKSKKCPMPYEMLKSRFQPGGHPEMRKWRRVSTIILEFSNWRGI